MAARAAVRVVDRVTEAGRACALAAEYGTICVAWADELCRACRVLFRWGTHFLPAWAKVLTVRVQVDRAVRDRATDRVGYCHRQVVAIDK